MKLLHINTAKFSICLIFNNIYAKLSSMKACFVGHSLIFDDSIEDAIFDMVILLVKKGYTSFIMGEHGDYEQMALSACRRVRNIYPHIKIEVVVTNLNKIYRNDKNRTQPLAKYIDVSIVVYDIENVHYKQQIIVSNQKMIDDCSLVIGYVDISRQYSGANRSWKYALKRNKKMINLYKKQHI